MNFGELLKRKNVTPSELAERADVSQGTVSRWVSGARKPSLVYIRKIQAAIPNTSLDEILDALEETAKQADKTETPDTDSQEESEPKALVAAH